MELTVLKNEEKRMNLILFLFLDIIPVVAFVYVLLLTADRHGTPSPWSWWAAAS